MWFFIVKQLKQSGRLLNEPSLLKLLNVIFSFGRVP